MPFIIVLYDCCLLDCMNMILRVSPVINVRLYDRQEASKQKWLNVVKWWLMVHGAEQAFSVHCYESETNVLINF